MDTSTVCSICGWSCFVSHTLYLSRHGSNSTRWNVPTDDVVLEVGVLEVPKIGDSTANALLVLVTCVTELGEYT